MSETIPEAWVAMPSDEDVRKFGLSGGPYDFGFLPSMARLLMAHPRFGAAWGRLSHA